MSLRDFTTHHVTCRLTCPPVRSSGDHNHVPPGKYFTFFQYLEYPFSRGAIQIRYVAFWSCGPFSLRVANTSLVL